MKVLTNVHEGSIAALLAFVVSENGKGQGTTLVPKDPFPRTSGGQARRRWRGRTTTVCYPTCDLRTYIHRQNIMLVCTNALRSRKDEARKVKKAQKSSPLDTTSFFVGLRRMVCSIWVTYEPLVSHKGGYGCTRSLSTRFLRAIK